VKENTSLPVIVTVTFAGSIIEDISHTLTGADPLTALTYLEALRPDAIGWNCGGGLEEAARITRSFCNAARLPVLVQPNAGIPAQVEGRPVFPVDPAEFAAAQRLHRDMGAALLGGCCGTTPAHISAMVRALHPWDERMEKEGGGCCGIDPRYSVELFSSIGRAVNKLRKKPPVPITSVPPTRITSGSACVEIGGKAGPVIIGERINPTGKKRLQQALRDADWNYVLDEAASQIAAGAAVLDVNAGLPGIDEEAVMVTLVELLQRTFPVPLQIDTGDPRVLEAALRVYNGKALVNSVNGKQSVMDAVFPLAAKYGGAVVALCLDDDGIPPTAEERLAIAGRIIAEAAKYGIPPADILVDTLTLPVSAEAAAARETLRALSLVKERFGGAGVKTILGVSNVSFGLPGRELINARFFAQALAAGLDAAIANPLSAEMTVTAAAHKALHGFDASCAAWIKQAQKCAPAQGIGAETLFAGRRDGKKIAADSPARPPEGGRDAPKSDDKTAALKDVIFKGYVDRAGAITTELLGALAPLEIIEGAIVPALDAVGAEYEAGRYFLPQLLLAADTVAASFTVLKAAMAAAGTVQKSKGEIVIATVSGDVHDIGKNIAKALLENYGYTVRDLGKNVPAEAIVAAVIEGGVKLVGLSALMTTTVANMEATIRALREADAARGTSCAIMAGGAVLTAEYAKHIGADFYVKDAMAGIAVAREVFGG
jgi:5-methyltetrahydrofolate--homocysteine methyltransferase